MKLRNLFFTLFLITCAIGAYNRYFSQSIEVWALLTPAMLISMIMGLIYGGEK